MINYLVGIEESQELLHTGICAFVLYILFHTHFITVYRMGMVGV